MVPTLKCCFDAVHILSKRGITARDLFRNIKVRVLCIQGRYSRFVMRVWVSSGRQSPVQAAQRHGVPLAAGRASPAVRAPERAPAEERALLVAGLGALRAQHRLGQLRHPAAVVRNLRTDLSRQVSGAEISSDTRSSNI